MGDDRLKKNKILSKNIKKRNKTLKANKKNNHNFPQNKGAAFFKHTEFDKHFGIFGGRKNSVEEDIVCFYSTVEGIIIFV